MEKRSIDANLLEFLVLNTKGGAKCGKGGCTPTEAQALRMTP